MRKKIEAFIAGGKAIKNLITGGKKSITPGGAINKVPTNVPTTVIQKKNKRFKNWQSKIKKRSSKIRSNYF